MIDDGPHENLYNAEKLGGLMAPDYPSKTHLIILLLIFSMLCSIIIECCYASYFCLNRYDKQLITTVLISLYSLINKLNVHVCFRGVFWVTVVIV